jgi:hypothetical protein
MKRGEVSPVGARAFAFGIVKSPCYEFTHFYFTISTRGPHKVIGISYEAFLHFVGWSSNRKEIHPRKTTIDIKKEAAQKFITFETAPFLSNYYLVHIT